MNEFQFCIIILAGGPALICFVLLLTMLFDYLLDRKPLKIFHSSFFRKIHNRIKWFIKDKKRKSLTWCCVKGDFVNKSDCHCINVGDDCSGCYIYEQNRTDIFINFDEGDEPF